MVDNQQWSVISLEGEDEEFCSQKQSLKDLPHFSKRQNICFSEAEAIYYVRLANRLKEWNILRRRSFQGGYVRSVSNDERESDRKRKNQLDCG